MISIRSLEPRLVFVAVGLIVSNLIWASAGLGKNEKPRTPFQVAAERSYFQVAALLVFLIVILST